MNFLRQAWTVAAKDLHAELRTKEALNASLSFALVILLLFSFAFDPTSDQTREMSGGLLWIVFAFAGTLILNRSFARELANDCLDALVASPISGAALFLGKCLANVTLLLAVELVCLPVFGIFYNVRWTARFWPLMLVLAARHLGADGGRDHVQRAHGELAPAGIDAADAGISAADSRADGRDSIDDSADGRPADGRGPPAVAQTAHRF